MTTLINGRFNALTYVIEIDDEVVYQAGNSPLESQGYVSAEDGVGLEKMKEYCKISLLQFVWDREGTVGSVTFCDDIDY